MNNAYTWLALIAVLYGVVLLLFVAHWVGQMTRWVERRRRLARPRVHCRMRLGE